MIRRGGLAILILTLLVWRAQAQPLAGGGVVVALPLVVQPAQPPATSTPTSTPPASATTTPPTPTPPTPTIDQSDAVVRYRLQGQASIVAVSYIDAGGNNINANVSLPWAIEFTASPDADLAIDAYSAIGETVALSCSISVNAVTVAADQTQSAIDGVVCERLAP
jgi:Mycobacterium membrane protein